MINLTKIQHEALIEILSVGVDSASKTMSAIAKEDVHLEVTDVRFYNRNDALAKFAANQTRLCGVSQHYQGAFEFESVLIFSENNSFELIRLMVGEKLSTDELTKLEQNALREIGNIILNGCVAALAHEFSKEFSGSLPAYYIGGAKDILGIPAQGVLMSQLNILFEKNQVQGTVAFLMDFDTFQDMLKQVDFYFAKYRTRA